jgi:hypothetical protein
MPNYSVFPHRDTGTKLTGAKLIGAKLIGAKLGAKLIGDGHPVCSTAGFFHAAEPSIGDRVVPKASV